MNIQILKSPLVIAALATLLSASAAFATEYTSSQTANGTAIILNSGDIVSVSGDGTRALSGMSGGSFAINPSDGSISLVSTGIVARTVRLDNASANLGSGSSIGSNYVGVDMTGTGSVFMADNLAVTVGSSMVPVMPSGSNTNPCGIRAADASQMSLGSDTKISLYLSDDFGTSGRGLIATGESTVLAVTDRLSVEITGGMLYGADYINQSPWGVSITSGGTADLGTNARIRVLEGAGVVSAGGGAAVILENGVVEAGVALIASQGASLAATGGTFEGVGTEGVALLMFSGTVAISGSTLSSEGYAAINLADGNNGDDGPGEVTVSGSIITSAGSVISSSAINATHTTATTVTLQGGTQASGETGILFVSDAGVNAASSVSVVVDGAGTAAAGRFIDGALSTSLTVRDGASWASAGASAMDSLVLSEATVVLSLTALGDGIRAGQLTLEGAGKSEVSFTVADSVVFSAEAVASADGEYVWDILTGTSVSGDYTASVNWNPANTGNASATWMWEDLGGGQWRMYDIVVGTVPEPATHAVFAGLAMVACACVLRGRRCQVRHCG
ncbi:MAG: hypothetical protein LBK99_17885 [Opitutaceae bacterium]|jgi:hypothetical protein|nr:hypothetical protein [Opitutaceae bacterium]